MPQPVLTPPPVLAVPAPLAELLAHLPDQAVVSHTTAAELWGLPVYGRHRPTVTVPRRCHLRRDGVRLHRVDLADDEIAERGVLLTAPLRTVTDCGRVLPLREAVAVADAAVRLRLVTQDQLTLASQRLLGPGSTNAIRAARWADGRAGSGNESLARTSLRLAGLWPAVPQQTLVEGMWAHEVDLLLRWARTAVECESEAHHAKWLEVRRDIDHHDTANRERFTLVRTHQAQLWPSDVLFLRKVLDAVCGAPGRRCARIRRLRERDDRPAG